MGKSPKVCPLLVHTQVPCHNGRDGLFQGESPMCRSEEGTSYENCTVFSSWYWRTQMKWPYRPKGEQTNVKKQKEDEINGNEI